MKLSYYKFIKPHQTKSSNTMSSQAKVHIIEEIDLPGAEVYYIKNAIDNPNEIFEKLIKEIPWKQEEIIYYGKKYNQPRLSCFIGQSDKPYTYSGITRIPEPMNETITYLTNVVQKVVNIIDPDHLPYTSTLGNRYRDGKDYISQHSDSEGDMIENTIIASLSLGQERFFDFYNKETKKKELRITLENGSLLLMGKNSQKLYTHGIPKQLTKNEERLNFTWRVMKENNDSKKKLDKQRLIDLLLDNS